MSTYKDENLTAKVREINENFTVWDNRTIWVHKHEDVTFDELVAITELLKREGQL